MQVKIFCSDGALVNQDPSIMPTSAFQALIVNGTLRPRAVIGGASAYGYDYTGQMADLGGGSLPGTWVMQPYTQPQPNDPPKNLTDPVLIQLTKRVEALEGRVDSQAEVIRDLEEGRDLMRGLLNWLAGN